MENNTSGGLLEKLSYNPTYKIENFSLEVLKEAIQEYYYGKKIPYEKELQTKLYHVRRQIEEQEKKYAKKYTSWELGRIKLNQEDFTL